MTTPNDICPATTTGSAIAAAWFGSRRIVFFSMILVLASLGIWVMADILWRGGMAPLEWGLLVLFAPLFSLVVFGFIQAVTGLVVLYRGDRLLINRMIPADALPDPATVTALLLPICNEDVSRVYEGLRTMFLDLKRKGAINRFDFFILSDSNDPNRWIEEEVSWVELCKQLAAFGKIFYRKRQLPLNKKSGNIGDFCRRWGLHYRHMIILDADSLMTADAMVRLTALMDANPRIGIIQTAPQLVGGETIFARMNQFASALFGPLFLAGLNYWQMSEGNYWGHNAIIRLKPFMDDCALPNLPGAERHARFMSHDYVEAALMRMAGYAVWLAPDIHGSYEGCPPTPLDHAQRDRRWCRGNLQHSWLLGARGLHGINRLHLGLGVMSYLSSLLWGLFLVLGTIHAHQEVQRETLRRFDYDVGIVSFLDIGGSRLAMLLFTATIGMLVLPKGLAWWRVLRAPAQRAAFGGAWRLTSGVVIEQTISMLLAPVHMVFNSLAVIGTWLGQEVAWLGQKRDLRDDSRWLENTAACAGPTLIGLTWAIIAYAIRPDCFQWLAPVWVGLLASLPVTILLSDRRCGQAARAIGLFSTPQETAPADVLRNLARHMRTCRQQVMPIEPLRRNFGLIQVVLDPYINAVHVSLLRQGRRRDTTPSSLQRLQDRLLREGPAALGRREIRALLFHAPSIAALHCRIWETADAQLHPGWRLAMQQYNSLTLHPTGALHH